MSNNPKLELLALESAIAVLQEHVDEIRSRMTLPSLAEDEMFRSQKTKKLAQCFWQFGYRIMSCKNKEETSPLDKPARRIWEIGTPAKDFMNKLCHCREDVFQHLLSNMDDPVKNSVFQLAQAFARIGWMDVKRNKNVLEISFKEPWEKRGPIRRFCSSEWSEIVNRQMILNALQSVAKDQRLKYDVFYDLKLQKLDNSTQKNDMQLDVVAQLEDFILVFETKSGFNLGIEKWIERARMFTADGKSEFITCYSGEDIPSDIFKPYKFFTFSKLETNLKTLLLQKFPAPTPAENKA